MTWTDAYGRDDSAYDMFVATMGIIQCTRCQAANVCPSWASSSEVSKFSIHGPTAHEKTASSD